MSKVIAFGLIAALSSCQAPPERVAIESLVLNVRGEAPGILSCTVFNPTNTTWYLLARTGNPSSLVKYWDGSGWVDPLEFRCGFGVWENSFLTPGQRLDFQTRANFSNAQVTIYVALEDNPTDGWQEVSAEATNSLSLVRQFRLEHISQPWLP